MTTATPTRSERESLGEDGRPGIHARIIAAEAYFPAFSIRERRRRRLVCGADEDAVTMAVDAGQAALASWGGDPAEIDGLFVAAAGAAAPQQHVVREALGLPPATRVVSFLADPIAGFDALRGAVDAVEGGSLKTVLVLASEGDLGAGRDAAAVAAIISAAAGGDGLELIELSRSSSLIHDQVKSSTTEARELDRRFLIHRYEAVAAEVAPAFADADEPVEEVFLAGGPSSSPPASVAALLPDIPLSRLPDGDFGLAGPLLTALEAARSRPGHRFGILVYGGGQAAAVAFRTPERPAPGLGRIEAPSETREPLPPSEVGPALSLPLESPFFARSWAESLRAEGARCTNCSHISFPASQRTICSRCGGHEWETVPLPRTGTVLTWIDNRFLPAGYPKRVISVLADLGDCRYWAPMPPEASAEEVTIDGRVELRLRVFTSRDGITAYSLKFLPAREEEEK